MNKVILMGRLTSDPKMDWTRSEDSKQYATYTLAVNRRFKRNGEQEADFINCVAWGAMAEFAEKYMKKGVMFAVVGRLNVRSWEKDGERHWTTTVIVRSATLPVERRMQRASRHRASRHRASLWRRLENKWGWRSRRVSIRLMKVLRMMICHSDAQSWC